MKKFKIYKIRKSKSDEDEVYYRIKGLITDDEPKDCGGTRYLKTRDFPSDREYEHGVGGRISLIRPMLPKNPELSGRNLLMLCIASSPKISKEDCDEYNIKSIPIRDPEGNLILIEVPDELYHDNVSSAYITCKNVYMEDYKCYKVWYLEIWKESAVDRWNWIDDEK